ncbi:hypothetical protein VTN00DRAFT_6952 [Thermoascus crustaceus]|uniref:uncharacterized protein n=1 Tax=Thermoascus crustaceus TaxID=5088 RepID=UPI00374430D2
MPPDLNSLPPSRSTSSSPLQQRTFPPTPEGGQGRSPSPRSSNISLAAAATMNAADLSLSRQSSRSSPRTTGGPSVSERRRSAVGMSLSLNDPSVPGPGELPSSDRRSSIGNAFRTASPTSIGGSPTIATGDPHHQRAPSLGEIHQELEQEQEAQVNRLLQMIRTQQLQLQQMQQQQQQQQQSSSSGTAVVDDSTPTSERSVSFPSVPPLPTPGTTTRSSTLSARRGSRSSQAASTSPSLRPVAVAPEQQQVRNDSESGEALARRSSRDESAYYQAETAMLTRENQMLRQRIRELERQISELTAATDHAPPASSNLATASVIAQTVEGAEETGGSTEVVPPPSAEGETEKT